VAVNQDVFLYVPTFPYNLPRSFLIVLGILFGAIRIVYRLLGLNQRPPVNPTGALSSAPKRFSKF